MKYETEEERTFYEGFKSLDYPDDPPGALYIRTPEIGLYRALVEIMELAPFTATEKHFSRHLQRIARQALTEYTAQRERRAAA